MLSINNFQNFTDLDDCLSMGGMSVEDDLISIMDDASVSRIAGNDSSHSRDSIEDIIVPLSREDPDRSKEVCQFRDDSLRSLRSMDSECWIDDELFVDAVDVFEDEDDRVATSQTSTTEAEFHSEKVVLVEKQKVQKHEEMQTSFTMMQGQQLPMNNVAFEEYWNAKMAQLARSMKRSEATRNQVIRQREILLAEQKRQQQMNQRQRQHAAQQSKYLSSASHSMVSNTASGGMMAIAQHGRRLNGFMSNMRPNIF